MRILEKHLHGVGVATTTRFDLNRFTATGRKRVNARAWNRASSLNENVFPRGHPARLAQAKRLRQIRNNVKEMMGDGRQWPSLRVDNYILFKPRKAS